MLNNCDSKLSIAFTSIDSLSEDSLNELNVGGGSLILAHSLLGLPGIPLSSSLESREHTWLLDSVVSLLGLLEQSVDLRFLLVAEIGLGISDFLGVGLEVRLSL